ncbi:MAG: radical SAM protein, partial [Bacillota bacterium]
YADELEQLGNFSPIFSLEGPREQTDARRGDGVFDAVVSAMGRCRERGIPFGASLTATRDNFDQLIGDEFIGFLDEQGCMYIWIFQYIPIGRDPDFDQMLTPEQRGNLAIRSNEIRAEYPLVVLDFWNDGRFVDGCIAGGRIYLRINAAGDVESCAFIHYATDNINDCSLQEALQNSLFMEFARRQPFN